MYLGGNRRWVPLANAIFRDNNRSVYLLLDDQLGLLCVSLPNVITGGIIDIW